LVVETLCKAFARLPDPVLLPRLPVLITTLRAGGADLAPLIREAGRIFPGRLTPSTSGFRRGRPSRPPTPFAPRRAPAAP
jgi:hypothetical protein